MACLFFIITPYILLVICSHIYATDSYVACCDIRSESSTGNNNSPAQNLIKNTTAYISLQYYSEVWRNVPGGYIDSARDGKRTDLKSTYLQYVRLWILWVTILEVRI